MFSLLDYSGKYHSAILSKLFHLSNSRNWRTAHGTRRTVFKARRMLFWLCVLVLPCTLSLEPCASVANAATVTIGWDPPAGSVAGYKIHYGTATRNYDFSVDLGNFDSCTISGLSEGQMYFFAATSYNADNIESALSKELAYTVPSGGTGSNEDGYNTEIVIEAENMSFHANGTQKGENWLLWSNGTISEEVDFTESGIYRFEILAKGDLAQGVGPEMQFVIDGEIKDSIFVNTNQSQIYIFDIEVSAGTHEIAVGFKNDLYDPARGIDRNLYVNNIVIYPFPDSGAPQSDEPLKMVEIEAENGSLNYPFEYGWDNDASSNQFIWVPNGTGNNRTHSSNAGYAEFVFEVPTTGDYVIWGCVLAKSRKDDSFYVSVDESAYLVWNTKRSKSWTWDQVSSQGGVDPVIYHLETGEHTLKIMQREDGTQIDKILITNDMKYAP